jgi:hypothetical protein
MDHFVCEGAPRDMGVDQGRACRLVLQRRGGRFARLPRRIWDARLRLALRDLQRYYPHQYEQLVGMARAAGLSVSRLALASVRALHQPVRALGYREAGSAKLVAAAPVDAVQRDTHAEGRLAARELSRPALTTALLAVNESGLAAAVSGVPVAGSCAAPGALLVRDCVERFENVAAASEWCLTRPCAPGVSILLADAQDELAAVEIGARERRVVAPVDSVLLPGAMALRTGEFAKSLGEPSGLDRLLHETLGVFVVASPKSQTLAAATLRSCPPGEDTPA